MTPEGPTLDIARLLEVLERHEVDYLVVGGVAAIAHGATRPTSDVDCLVRRSRENLSRLAAAMRELHARLRVGGMSDEEASALPTPLDADSLARLAISTWRTDAGDFDVLTDIPGRHGALRGYEELIARAALQAVGGIVVRVAALDDVIASKEAADRPKDREALPELRRLAAEEE
jgi:hypothetical protein